MSKRTFLITIIIVSFFSVLHMSCASDNEPTVRRFVKNYVQFVINNSFGEIESDKRESDFLHPDWGYPGNDDIYIAIVDNFNIIKIQKGANKNINNHDKNKLYVAKIKFDIIGWINRKGNNINFNKKKETREFNVYISKSTGEPLILHSDFAPVDLSVYNDVLHWLETGAKERPEAFMEAYEEVKKLKQ